MACYNSSQSYTICWCNSEIQQICSIFFLFAKLDEWRPAFRLTKRYLIYGWATKLTSIKTNKKISTVQQGSKHDNTVNKRRRQPSTEEKKKEEHTGRFKLFLHTEINTVHKFLCACNTFCTHITCTIVTVHVICESLAGES